VSPVQRLAGLIRLIHPFPSLLDGLATTGIALVAGGDAVTATRLGASMLALQASIGALNDIVDAPADAGHKRGKPIPSGVVAVPAARGLVVLGAGLGLALAIPSGLIVLATAILILVVGYGYDLAGKGTRWSWLPFAVGIPLLPVFAWLGATGRLPPTFAILVPAAVVAGAALAIANSRADVERDLAAGRASVATWLGPDRAWRVSAVLLLGVVAVALGSLALKGAAPSALVAALLASAVIGGGLAWASRSATTAARRERAWQLQAIGVALLAAAWLAGLGDLGQAPNIPGQ
jgi:4-hydroxybenzoate polyprenyltransferase